MAITAFRHHHWKGVEQRHQQHMKPVVLGCILQTNMYTTVVCSVFLVFEYCAHDLGRLLDTMPRRFHESEVKCLLKQVCMATSCSFYCLALLPSLLCILCQTNSRHPGSHKSADAAVQSCTVFYQHFNLQASTMQDYCALLLH